MDSSSTFLAHKQEDKDPLDQCSLRKTHGRVEKRPGAECRTWSKSNSRRENHIYQIHPSSFVSRVIAKLKTELKTQNKADVLPTHTLTPGASLVVPKLSSLVSLVSL